MLLSVDAEKYNRDGINLYNYGSSTTINYVAMHTTKGTYYIDANGTVYQATTGYE